MPGSSYMISAVSELSDDEIIARVLDGEIALYELLVRRYNQRVYRAVRAVLRDDIECEDTMQEAYVRAYLNLGKFEHRASFCTWVTRIAVREALARLEKRQREVNMEPEDQNSAENALPSHELSPEEAVASTETRTLLEQAILALPFDYRTVIMLRDIEEMNTAETASALDVTEEAVKVRLHRARAMLRKELYARAGATSADAFQFGASRCDRVTAAVLARVQDLPLRA
jgi:RNA polymerase sigma-70 factor, ECF subfamily